MSFYKKLALCGAAASSTFVSTQSEALTLTIDFTGTVTSAYSYAQLGALPAPGGVSGGEQVVGSVTYDTNTATSVTPTYQYPNQSSQAFKFPTSGSVGYSYTINGTTWSSGNQIVVETANEAPSPGKGGTTFDQLWITNNGAFGQSESLGAATHPGSSVSDYTYLWFTKSAGGGPGGDANLLTSSQLPTSPTDLNFLGSTGSGYISSGNPADSTDGFDIYFSIDTNSISVTTGPSTPQPPAFALPLTGKDAIFTNVVAGGAAFDGVPDQFHTADQAYYALDFDVNLDHDGNGQADSASVLAAAAGTIVAVGGVGKCSVEPVCVVIDHGNGYYTEYREFSSLDQSLALGATVAQGDMLGSLVGGNRRSCGSSPCSTPDHLHFQVLYDTAGNGPGPGDSSLTVSQLQTASIGGLNLTSFQLGSGSPSQPGQGAVGFVSGSGDVNQNLGGVVDQTTSSALKIGDTSTGQLIVNGPIKLDV